ncbi:hypothetical protein Vadar_021083 [Vaccinium darrowii]|uniref:Uncharacterized protein n=1 Tax=Vaccinium darrowii TaxID=229202 RepID=A0ACB7X2M3_9ERIC|nr:hypothetical protein Vadar_021083 [Vaccinium darrowii]
MLGGDLKPQPYDHRVRPPTNGGQYPYGYTPRDTQGAWPESGPQLGPEFRPIRKLIYTRPYSGKVENEFFPKGYRVPEFHLFSGEDIHEGVETYLSRFKTARFKCRVSLLEKEYVRLVLNGLNFKLKKKFHGVEFRDLFELSAKATRYEKILKEEADLTEMVNKKPHILRTGGIELKAEVQVSSSSKAPRAYSFDITKAEVIFDQLVADKMIKFPQGHKLLS